MNLAGMLAPGVAFIPTRAARCSSSPARHPDILAAVADNMPALFVTGLAVGLAAVVIARREGGAAGLSTPTGSGWRCRSACSVAASCGSSWLATASSPTGTTRRRSRCSWRSWVWCGSTPATCRRRCGRGGADGSAVATSRCTARSPSPCSSPSRRRWPSTSRPRRPRSCSGSRSCSITLFAVFWIVQTTSSGTAGCAESLTRHGAARWPGSRDVPSASRPVDHRPRRAQGLVLGFLLDLDRHHELRPVPRALAEVVEERMFGRGGVAPSASARAPRLGPLRYPISFGARLTRAEAFFRGGGACRPRCADLRRPRMRCELGTVRALTERAIVEARDPCWATWAGQAQTAHARTFPAPAGP